MSYILLILDLKLEIIETSILKPEFHYQGRTFVELKDNEFFGFYDWLRSSNKQIVGVRFSSFIDWDLIISNINEYEYVEKINDKIIEIFFDTNRSYNDDLSCDQDFGDNLIYGVVGQNIYSISFNKSNMLGTELDIPISIII